METGLPFDDIRRLLKALPSGDDAAAARAARHFGTATGVMGDLGRLETLAIWLARWSGRPPAVRRPLVAIFAGTHGFAVREGARDPVGEAQQVVELIAAGAAPVSALCAQGDLALKVFDLALDIPTGDFTVEDALDERACAATMAFGMESVAGGTDLMCISDCGADSAVSTAAILAALQGGDALDWLDGSGDEPVSVSPAPAEAALRHHGGRVSDPFETLRRLGGRETAAIAGAIVAARMERIPVVLDGPAAWGAAAVLHALQRDSLDHCLLAQMPKGKNTTKLVSRLELGCVFDMPLASSAGVAVALSAAMMKTAASVAQHLYSSNVAQR